MIPTYYFPVLFNSSQVKQVFSGVSRVYAAREVIFNTWEYDRDFFNSPQAQILAEKWAAYLDLETESCQYYDTLKRELCDFYGVSVFEWLRDYTTYLIRNTRLSFKYSGVDSVAESVEQRIKMLS